MYKWKNFENPLTFGKDMNNKKVAQFFWLTVYMYSPLHYTIQTKSWIFIFIPTSVLRLIYSSFFISHFIQSAFLSHHFISNLVLYLKLVNHWISWQIHQNTTFIFNVIVDVSATTAAFVETTVHHVLLWRTVSTHRYAKVGRTPRLGSSICLVLSCSCSCFLLTY